MYRALKYILLGCLTHIPALHSTFARGTGGTSSARYCYSVWLRHLVRAHEANLPIQPKRIAEIGPGDSLGIGLSALIAGADQYLAFDVVAHASSAKNLAVFDELCGLFQRRADIPGPEEFPAVRPMLKDYRFPHHILDSERLAAALEPERLAMLRRSLISLSDRIRYIAPWDGAAIRREEPVDFIFSQAVLEHVDDLDSAYRAMNGWLAPRGILSHQIDFKSHGLADKWNGHLAYSNLTWRLMRGKLPYLLNRRVYSEHLAYLAKYGFIVRSKQAVIDHDGLRREQLAPRFRFVTDEDLITSGVHLQCCKAA
jgi:SAM-dependent methyltransferase